MLRVGEGEHRHIGIEWGNCRSLLNHMLTSLLVLLALNQSPPPLISAEVEPTRIDDASFAQFAPATSAVPPPVAAEVRAAPEEKKHEAPTWQVAALATAIIPTSLDGAAFVFGMRGELDIFRVGAFFTLDRGGVTPFTMSQTNEWNGLLGYSLINNKWARIRLQGGMSVLSGDNFATRFAPSAGLTARAGHPNIAAEVGAIFTPVGGLRQLDARAELVLRGGIFELHGGYRVRFYDGADAGTLETLFATAPLAGPSVAVGLTF